MANILALDQGTTSSRAIVFNGRGEALATAQREFQQIYPRPGWVEHDPDAIWSSQAAVAQEALRSAGLDTSQVAAIGVTNQRETTLVWDRRTGEPVCNAIVWQDRRTAGLCDKLRADGMEDLFRERTGLVIDAYFSGTKLAWILDNVEGARARAEQGELAFGTVDTWLLWKLTGGALHVTDPSNASRTLLYDIHAGGWDDELLEVLRIPRDVLPGVRSSSEVYAEASAPDALRGIPIAGILGDQQAATMGQLCLTPGLAKNTYGTGCFLLVNTGDEPKPSRHKLLTTVAWRRDGRTSYALEGSIFVGGAIVQWLRDGLGIIEEARDVEALAASVPDTGDVFLVPALVGLGAPHWDPYARGAIVGLTRGTAPGHIARAALEGIAFQIADLFEAMQKDAALAIPELRVDGGAAANDLLMQMQADILQRPVARPTHLETTALGAAYVAGLAVGLWPSTDELLRNWSADRRFEPSLGAQEASERLTRWREAVERAKGWARPD